MLHRNMTTLYTMPDDKGANPDTQQTDKEGENKGAEKLFTQEEINRLMANEKRQGKASAEKAILEALGVSNVDEIKAIVEAKRKADESAKSETEKLAEALAQKDRELAEVKQKAELAEKRRIEAIRDSAIRNALNDAHDTDTALLAFQTKNGAAIESLIDDNGNVDTKELEKLTSTFRSANAYLFKGTGKGSPSNSDGRLLKPNAEIEKAARQAIREKFKF